MRRLAQLLAAVALGALLAQITGCKSAAECRKARLSAVSSWEGIKAQAGKHKLGGGPGYDEMSESQKKKHFDDWTDIEGGAHLVWESFAFEQITWNAANNGRTRVNAAFDRVEKTRYASFDGALATANKRFTEADAACR